MRYFALAVDFDATRATHGHVSESTEDGLEQLRATGRHLILVSGRTLPDLALAPPPGDHLLKRLATAGIAPSTGEVVVALSSADIPKALVTLHDVGLDATIRSGFTSAQRIRNWPRRHSL